MFQEHEMVVTAMLHHLVYAHQLVLLVLVVTARMVALAVLAVKEIKELLIGLQQLRLTLFLKILLS